MDEETEDPRLGEMPVKSDEPILIYSVSVSQDASVDHREVELILGTDQAVDVLGFDQRTFHVPNLQEQA